MAGIYLLSDYGKLTKKDETLEFVRPDNASVTLFPFKTDHIFMIGNVSVTGEALRFMSKYGIGATIMSRNGRFNGRLSFGDGKNVLLRQKQYRILDNSEMSLKLAKSIVAGKIRNELSFMQRIKRKKDDPGDTIPQAINDIKHILLKAEKAEDVDILRGLEGYAAKKYFEVFGLNIIPEWAEFPNRSKNPPLSNVNAVLSFLYTLLMYRVETAVEASGLDAYAGCLHAVNYGKTALVFDLMEEFRTPVADTVCCSLFNLGTMAPGDFEKRSPDESDETQGILLTPDGIKKVISAFESKIESEVLYTVTREKLSYSEIIYKQVQHYKRVIAGEETDYNPFYFK